MIMKLFILFLPLLLAKPALGGGGVTGAGDGGHGVVCFVPQKDRYLKYQIELLDLFEARRIHDISIPAPYYRRIPNDFLPNLRSQVNRHISRAVSKLQSFESQDEFKDLLSLLSKANDLVFIVKNSYLVPDTKDHGTLLVKVPQNCKIVQLAGNYFVNGDRQIWIRHDFAERMTDRELAALLIHELVHAYFGKQESTLAVRQFVTFLFGDSKFRAKNKDKFFQLVKTKRSVSEF